MLQCISIYGAAAWSCLAVLLEAATSPCAAEEQPAGQQAKREYKSGVLIRFEGSIDSMLEEYLFRKLDVARQRGADLVVIEIDSPGGLVTETLEIAERLRDLDWAHTVAYVPRQAISGAAIVALACDEIVMAPQASIGDAGPIFLGKDFLFRHAPEKFRSHLAEQVRALAKAKGRPPALAEAMVDMDLEVYEATNKRTGTKTFMSQHEIDSDVNPEDWERGPLVFESRKGHFLEVTGQRAVDLNLAQGTAAGRDELRTRHGLPEGFLVLEPGGVDTAVYILNLPIVTGLLFVIGLIALYVEFHSPGICIGGLTAGLCFALFFWSRFLGGTADWLDVVLFLAGLTFLGVEIFVLPGFGVAGLTGLLLLLASIILASQRFILPSTDQQLSTFGTTLTVIVLSGAVFAVAAMVLSKYLGSIPILGRIALAPPESATAPEAAAHDSAAALQVGDIGVADFPLRPAGKASFGEWQVEVVTDGSFISRGQRVRIVQVSRGRIVVTEADA